MVKSLTGIRFYLFLIVFLRHLDYYQGKMHFPELNTLHWIFFAMSFFFILSGFCVGLGYSDKFQSLTKENICLFLRKRFLKLYPLYFITGLVMLVLIYLPLGSKYLSKFIFRYVTLICSWFPSAARGGNDVGWFVSALFFCYLLTPVLLHYLNSKSLKHLVVSLLMVCLMSVIMIITCGNSPKCRLYTFPLARFCEYGYGLILSLFYKKYLANKTYKIRAKSLFDAIFISLIFIMVHCISFQDDWYVLHRLEYWLWTPVIGFFILYLCHRQKSWLTNILEHKFSLFLASISLEMYLIHYPLLRISDKYIMPHSLSALWMIGATIFVLTFVLAYFYNRLQARVYSFYQNKKL